MLVALDLSAAFDCIDHRSCISRMQHTYGLSGKALSWLESYLHGRSHVKWKSSTSDSVAVSTGVPQGSSLGPLLFTLYVAPLAGLIQSFGVRYHQYADDTQLYIAVSRQQVKVQLAMLEDCIASVHQWLQENGLSLNASKSDAVQFSLGRGRSNITEVSVSGVAIQPSATVKSLGATLDRYLSFDQHVNSVCKACYFHIRALRHVRESLPDEVAKKVACSIVTSRLDYCNALYHNMSEANFAKLQLVQNTLARVVVRKRKYDHITPSLRELHWLPVKHRSTFKIATLTHKLLQHHQPAYLYDLIQPYVPPRELRSSDKGLLRVSRVNKTTTSAAFRHSSPEIWNSLPQDIRDITSLTLFRRKLKTHLFAVALDT